MDFLTSRMKPMYFKYLTAAFGGALISGILICLLPAVAGADAIWFSMPLTELIVAVFVAVKMKQYTRQLVNGSMDSK